VFFICPPASHTTAAGFKNRVVWDHLPLWGNKKLRLGVASASVCGSKISVRRVMEVFKAKRLDASEGH